MDLPSNQLLQFLILHGYWIALPIMIVEGPIATVVMAFFASFGYFNPFVILVFSVLADLVSDTLFYLIGYWNGNRFIKRFGRYFKLSEKTLPIISGFYKRHGGKSVFWAKLLKGTVPPIYIVAGFSRMNMGRFYLFAALGGMAWSSVLVTLGYYFGRHLRGSFEEMGKFFSITGLILVLLLSLIIVYKFYLSKLLSQKLKLLLDKAGNNEKNATGKIFSGQK